MKRIIANRRAAAQRRLVAAARVLHCGIRRAGLPPVSLLAKYTPFTSEPEKPPGLMRPRLVMAAGGTSTGKTTCVNALLVEIAKTPDRVILIEDRREPQCQARNFQRAKDGAASLSDLVRSSLRLRPGRIPIGEVGGAAGAAVR